MDLIAPRLPFRTPGMMARSAVSSRADSMATSSSTFLTWDSRQRSLRTATSLVIVAGEMANPASRIAAVTCR